MSSTTSGGVYDALYAPFRRNPPRDRKVAIERMYIRVLTELACNRFKWTGVPDTIDLRFLELALFRQALCVFYWDDEFSRYMALRAAGTGRINMYDNPTTYTVLGNAMFRSRTLDSHECVPIWANFLRIPDWDIVLLYASKLADLDRTIEINLDAMRYTYIMTVPEDQRLSYMNIMRQHKEGQPIIFGTQALNPELIQSFPVTIDKDVVLNLQMSKAKLWSETMTLLGINNANQDKKERLVAAEVGANDGQVLAARNIAMDARQFAVEAINKKYDLSISVEWNMNPTTAPTAPEGLI